MDKDTAKENARRIIASLATTLAQNPEGSQKANEVFQYLQRRDFLQARKLWADLVKELPLEQKTRFPNTLFDELQTAFQEQTAINQKNDNEVDHSVSGASEDSHQQQRIEKAVKREVVRRVSEDGTSEGYKKSEEEIVARWQEENKDADSEKLSKFKESDEFKDRATDHFSQSHPEVERLIAEEKTHVYSNPEYDPAIRELNVILKEKDQKLKESDVSGKEDARIKSSKEKTLRSFAKRYQYKAQAYAPKMPELNKVLVPDKKPSRESLKKFFSFIRRVPRQIPPQTSFEPMSVSEPVSGSSPPSGGGGPVTHGINSVNNLAQRGRSMVNAGREAQKTARLFIQAASWLARIPPWGWVIIGIIILILLIIFAIFGGAGDPDVPPVVITKTVVPDAINNPPNSQDVTFSISTSFAGDAADIIVNDPIPDNAEFVSATGVYETDKDANGNVTAVIWSLADNGAGGSTNSTITQSATSPSPGITQQPSSTSFVFDEVRFTSYGFPSPDPGYTSKNPPSQPSQELMNNWKNVIMPHAVKASQLTGVDIGILGMWTMYEQIPSTYYDNCNDGKNGGDFNPNTVCPFNNWQVGYGVRPMETLSYLEEAFEKMHPGDSAQKVGQKVISESGLRDPKREITNPTSFPNITVSEIVTGAKGDQQKRMLAGILMKDDAIGMYILAKVFKPLQGSWMAASMDWGSYYKKQLIINYIKAVYDAGISGEVGPITGSTAWDKTFQIVLRPKSTTKDTYIVNTASAYPIGAEPGTDGSTSSGGGIISGAIANLLPNPLPDEPLESAQAKSNVILGIKNNPSLIDIYKQASAATGIPWQVLAGIHYREGSSQPGSSLVSGRGIGKYEPDVPLSACNSGKSGPGIPIRIGKGCGFSSLLDTAIYAGNLLKGKIGKTPQTFQEVVTALSRYNGGGNSNCGKTPYASCPKLFYGEDDTYVLNIFDARHTPMYIVYCKDHVKCSPFPKDTRPGALTAAKWVTVGFPN